MIRVLHILSSLELGGGIQTVIKNYYSYMDSDLIKFDFIVHGSKQGELENYFTERGSTVYHISPRKENPLKNYIQIKNIIKNGNYDVVHNHQDYHGAYSLLVAKFYGVKGRISHTHVTQRPYSFLKKIIKTISVYILKKTATDFFACGEVALKCLLDADYKNRDYYIMRNALALKRFVYLEEKRLAIREQLGVEDSFVIGHAGRFSAVKNHKFILDIFAKVKLSIPNAKLVFAGNGELFEEIKQKAKDMNIEDDVLFLGVRNDVPELLMAMDMFLLPSFNEGFPVVILEAQNSNLSCICSDRVPSETNITGNIKYYPMDNVDVWCDEIGNVFKTPKERMDCTGILQQAGYDICVEADKLVKMYTDIVKR